MKGVCGFFSDIMFAMQPHPSCIVPTGEKDRRKKRNVLRPLFSFSRPKHVFGDAALYYLRKRLEAVVVKIATSDKAVALAMTNTVVDHEVLGYFGRGLMCSTKEESLETTGGFEGFVRPSRDLVMAQSPDDIVKIAGTEYVPLDDQGFAQIGIQIDLFPRDVNQAGQFFLGDRQQETQEGIAIEVVVIVEGFGSFDKFRVVPAQVTECHDVFQDGDVLRGSDDRDPQARDTYDYVLDACFVATLCDEIADEKLSRLGTLFHDHDAAG